MKCSPSVHPTSRREQALTLVETTVSMAMLGILGLIAFGVLNSGMILSGQNTGVNLSASRGRTTLDYIGEQSRYSIEQPQLITVAGAAATSSADGILVKHYVGSPYVVKEPNGTTGDIIATATQFCIEYRADLPAPEVGDFVLMETVQRPELEISAVANMSASGNVLRKLVTTTTAIGELARPSAYRVGASFYHKEAFVFAATESGTNPRYELRYFRRVRGSTNFATPANYEVMASGYRQLSSQAFFATTTIDGLQTTVLRALCHSSGQKEYVERNSTVSGNTTVPIQLRLWAMSQ